MRRRTSTHLRLLLWLRCEGRRSQSRAAQAKLAGSDANWLASFTFSNTGLAKDCSWPRSPKVAVEACRYGHPAEFLVAQNCARKRAHKRCFQRI